MIHISIKEEALSLAECQALIEDEAVGGIVHFVGTVRNQTKGNQVTKLEFEAYEKMALLEMEKIGKAALQQFDIERFVLQHRIGTLYLKEIAVIIVVGAKHRKAAFQACEFAIDSLKKTVPIWKKEFFIDGSHWVSAHP